MKIMVDENIPFITVEELRDKGHDIIDIRKTPDMGMDDNLLWDLAQREKCLFITTDKGFSVYREDPHYGLIIIRLRQPNRLKIHRRVIQALSHYSDWKGLMVIMRDYTRSHWKSRISDTDNR